MQTNAYGKPIRDSELLRRIKKARTRHQLLVTRHRRFHPSSFATSATLLQKMRRLSLYSPNGSATIRL
jgi:hypothetical protein